jgi:hypothetical protein
VSRSFLYLLASTSYSAIFLDLIQTGSTLTSWPVLPALALQKKV